VTRSRTASENSRPKPVLFIPRAILLKSFEAASKPSGRPLALRLSEERFALHRNEALALALRCSLPSKVAMRQEGRPEGACLTLEFDP